MLTQRCGSKADGKETAMGNIDPRRAYREQQLRERAKPVHLDTAVGALEGFLLIRPDGTLTAEVVHVQCMDNHPAGPDVYAMVSFADGSNVEFANHAEVAKVKPATASTVDSAVLTNSASREWGVERTPWR
jgi:hypothetical protein